MTTAIDVRLLTDAHFPDYASARQEADRRRRAAVAHDPLIVKIERSRYGGYVVRAFLAELMLDAAGEGNPLAPGLDPLRPNRVA